MNTLFLICLIAGGLGSILQGMVGVGTGIIIIPLLTFLLPHYGFSSDISIHIALATSMAAIVMTSIVALNSHHKRGNVNWDIFKRMIIFSIIGALLGALVASHLHGKTLEIIFGIFMILLGLHMFFKKTSHDSNDQSITIKFPWIASGGLGIGFVGSIIGTGGGVLMVPYLHAFKIKMRYAVGTSTGVGLPVAIAGTITYILAGLNQTPPGSYTIGYLYWPAFLAISFAGFICAPYGAKLATVLPTKLLQKIFSGCMIIVGLKMLTF